jgi:hypothetical protein
MNRFNNQQEIPMSISALKPVVSDIRADGHITVHLRLLPIFFLFLGTLIGCEGPGPEAPWVYGEWTEVLTGERVEFRRGGTVSWFGEEGTFEFVEPTHRWLHHDTSIGDIKISVGDLNYRFPYDTTDGEWLANDSQAWWISFDDWPVLIMGEPSSNLILRRFEDFPEPFNPPGMEKIATGFPGGFYKRIENAWVVNGEIYATERGAYDEIPKTTRFNQENQSWQVIAPNQWHLSHYSPQAVISEKSDAKRYRLQNEATWKPLPKVEDVIGLEPPPQFGMSSNHVDELVPPQLVGTNLFQIASVLRNDIDSDELYRIDLSAGNPRWNKVTLPVNRGFDLSLTSSGESNTLYLKLSAWEDEFNTARLYKSENQGDSWTQLPEVDGLKSFGAVLPYLDGIAVNVENSVGLYNANTHSWVVHSIDAPSGSYTKELYVDNDELFHVCRYESSFVKRINLDGSTDTIIEFDNDEWPGGGTPAIQVVGGEILVSGISIWRVAQ